MRGLTIDIQVPRLEECGRCHAKGAEPEILEVALRAAGIDRPLQFEIVSPGAEPLVPLETAEAVEFLAGRPSSRHFQNATQSGAVKPCRRHREAARSPQGERG